MSDKAESFIELARKNLALAKLIRNSDPGNAVFHPQQAAEKRAKAVLTLLRAASPALPIWSHDRIPDHRP